MSHLPALPDYGGGGIQRRDARGVARAVSGIRAGASTDLARVDATADVFGEIMSASSGLTAQAMAHTVQVAQAEAIGASMVPHAAGRLQYLANQHTLGEADLINQANRMLGRLAR